ncbi:Cell surface glycoprotein 1 [Frankliniella fusca]|uniref:Cell surface glycoprotein 1 n=1 Tax=Frankliniella fusca TaxID=407009 RepID=A0AAE1HRK3_9NEOP|nr:Cell surface glycoprotein 1 [Frankliniella fusca]
MGKTLLLAAIAAVFCTLGAVTSSPVRLDKQNLKHDWTNVTAILERFKGSLQVVQAKIYETEQNVADGVQDVLQSITNAAQDAAAKWNQTVDELAEEARGLGVNVEDCILAEQPLYDVTEGLVSDVQKCIAPNLDSVEKALADLGAVRDKAQDLLDRAEAVVAGCNSSGPLAFFCVAGQMPALQVESLGLVNEAVVRAGIASAKATKLFAALAGPCSSKATSNRAAEAAKLVDTAAQCIKDKMSEPVPSPQPEPTPEPQPEPTTEPQPEPTTEPQPEPTPEPQPEPTPEPQPEPTPEPQPEPTPEPQPEPTPEPQPEPTPEPQPEPTPEPQPEPTPEPQPEPTPEPQPEPTPEPQPEPTPEPQPEPTPEPQPEPTPEPQPEPTPEPQPEPTPEPQPEPTPEPQPEPTTEPQPEPTPEPQPEPTPEPQPEPTPEPQPEPTPEPQPEPTTEPQPEPTPEPQP